MPSDPTMEYIRIPTNACLILQFPTSNEIKIEIGKIHRLPNNWVNFERNAMRSTCVIKANESFWLSISVWNRSTQQLAAPEIENVIQRRGARS